MLTNFSRHSNTFLVPIYEIYNFLSLLVLRVHIVVCLWGVNFCSPGRRNRMPGFLAETSMEGEVPRLASGPSTSAMSSPSHNRPSRFTDLEWATLRSTPLMKLLVLEGKLRQYTLLSAPPSVLWHLSLIYNLDLKNRNLMVSRVQQLPLGIRRSTHLAILSVN